MPATTTQREPAATSAMELKREFTMGSAFAMAFAFISPIVALYAIFALVIGTGGPAAWWGFAFVLVGQLLLAAVFAECASRWPLEGSVYQWARRTRGTAYGWFTGWAYLWTLVIAMAAVAYGAAGFLPVVLDIEPFGKGDQLLVALGLLAFATLANTAGRRWLKILVIASIAAEIIGSIGIGTVLLLFHRENPIGVVFESYGAGGGSGGYLWSGMLAAMAIVGWAFVGFESAGAISEEVRDPRRAVPKAIILSLVIVAAVVLFSALAIILAIPDLGAVVAGGVGDPVAATITAQLGDGVARPLFALFVIGFMASLLALQTSASRVAWSFARDAALPGSGVLRRLSSSDRLPVNAIVLAGIVAALILTTTQSDDVYVTLISFTTGGFFISFALPTLGVLGARLRGRWSAGPFTLGRWGLPVTCAAAAWAVFELVNIAWPRSVGVPWYQDYGVLLMTAIIGALGVACYLPVRHRIAWGTGDDETLEPQPAAPLPGERPGVATG